MNELSIRIIKAAIGAAASYASGKAVDMVVKKLAKGGH